jgi:hypothetical protein
LTQKGRKSFEWSMLMSAPTVSATVRTAAVTVATTAGDHGPVTAGGDGGAIGPPSAGNGTGSRASTQTRARAATQAAPRTSSATPTPMSR